MLLEKIWYLLLLGSPASAISSHFLLLNFTQIHKSRLQSFKDSTSKQRNSRQYFCGIPFGAKKTGALVKSQNLVLSEVGAALPNALSLVTERD